MAPRKPSKKPSPEMGQSAAKPIGTSGQAVLSLPPLPADKRCAKCGHRLDSLRPSNGMRIWECVIEDCPGRYLERLAPGQPRERNVHSQKENIEGKVDPPVVSHQEQLANRGPASSEDRIPLERLLDWYRWEFLRRSEKYKAVWQRLEMKYASQPKSGKQLDQWREEIVSRGEFAYRSQEEKVNAYTFGLYDLYAPEKQFPQTAPPEFWHPAAVELADQTTICDLLHPIPPDWFATHREAPRLRTPYLKNDHALVVIDLRATDERLREEIIHVAHKLRSKPSPKEKREAKTIFASPQAIEGLRAALAREEVTVKRLPNKVAYMERYLRVWDLNQRLMAKRLRPLDRFEEIANRLPAEWMKDSEDPAERVQDYLEKARRLIRAAANGPFPTP